MSEIDILQKIIALCTPQTKDQLDQEINFGNDTNFEPYGVFNSFLKGLYSLYVPSTMMDPTSQMYHLTGLFHSIPGLAMEHESPNAALDKIFDSYECGVSFGAIECAKYFVEIDELGDHALNWINISMGKEFFIQSINLRGMLHERNPQHRDYEKANMYYRVGCIHRDADAYYNLGRLHGFGRGVEQDYLTAAKYYYVAADMDCPGACFNIANLYYDGRGVSKNLNLAIEFFTKAMKLGDKSAANNLAMIHMDESLEVFDLLKARRFYEEGVKLLNIDCMHNLAKIYYFGQGVEVDYLRAAVYLEVCVKFMDQSAEEFLNEIKENHLTDDDIALIETSSNQLFDKLIQGACDQKVKKFKLLLYEVLAIYTSDPLPPINLNYDAQQISDSALFASQNLHGFQS